MKQKLLIIAAIIILCFLIPYVVNHFTTTQLGDKILNLGTITGVEDSDIFSNLHPEFTKKTKIKVNVIVKESAEASLQLAREGKIDAVLVNAEGLEKQLVDEGFGINRTPVMSCDSDDGKLKDIYHIMAVNPAEHPQVNNSQAKQYIEWITSKGIQKLIGEFKKEGKAIFNPAAKMEPSPKTEKQ